MYKIAINRPIATLMYVVTLVIFGYMSFKTMPSALFPNIDFPLVTVKTIYPGAEAGTVESQVTQKIEEALSTIGGVDSIKSTTSNGVSIVIVKFFLDRNIDEATNDVRDKVSAVLLPKDAKRPLVSKLDIGSAPVIKVFLNTKEKNLQNLMLFADEVAKPMLQKINGVGGVNIVGYRDKEIKIFPDIYKLNKYGITFRELNEIIKDENVKLGGAKLITKSKEIIPKTDADAKTINQLKNIIIKDDLRLKD